MRVETVATASMAPVPRLLLRAALLQGQAAAVAWAAARPAFERDRRGSHDAAWLLALVYRNLGRNLEARDVAWLKGIYRRTWYVNQLKRRELAEAVRALRAHRISALLLGGLPLALLYYGELGLRPVNDSEIAVGAGDGVEVAGVLESLGWRFQGLARSARMRRIVRRWHLTRPDGGVLLVRCEPRSTLVCQTGARPSTADIAAGSVGLALDGEEVRVVAPGDQLLDILVRDSRPPASPSLRSVVDVFMVLRACGDGTDWPNLVSAARRRRLIAPLRAILTPLVHEVGLAVPGSVMRELEGADGTRLSRLPRALVAPIVRRWLPPSLRVGRSTDLRSQ